MEDTEINKSTKKKLIKRYRIGQFKFWRGVDNKNMDISKCWPWKKGCNTGGYGLYSVRNSAEQYEKTGRAFTQVLAHRVVAGIVRQLDPEDYVLHKCDNPPCCNPNHLMIGTAVDNMQDAIAKGRHRGRQKILKEKK